MTLNPLAGMTADEIGPLVAQAMHWSGPDIFAAMLEAVTDANFHTEAAALIRAWHAPKLTEAAPALATAK